MPDYAGVIFQTLSVLYSRGDFDAYALAAVKSHESLLVDCVTVRLFLHRRPPSFAAMRAANGADD